ncbi:MAG: type II toxin-antitoxin system Phd/YefM family antitoxin [Candidatus Saccharimonadales bacterium]
MDTVINVHDFKTNYSKYLEQVANGEKLLLGKHGKAVAQISPLPSSSKPRVPGALKGKGWISDDFDEPLISMWDISKNKT